MVCSNYVVLDHIKAVFAEGLFAQSFHQVIQDLLLWPSWSTWESMNEKLMGRSLLFCHSCLLCAFIMKELDPLIFWAAFSLSFFALLWSLGSFHFFLRSASSSFPSLVTRTGCGVFWVFEHLAFFFGDSDFEDLWVAFLDIYVSWDRLFPGAFVLGFESLHPCFPGDFKGEEVLSALVVNLSGEVCVFVSCTRKPEYINKYRSNSKFPSMGPCSRVRILEKK